MPVITVTIEDTGVRALLDAVSRRAGDMRPAMRIVGETVLSSVMENFEAGGRPKPWQDLSPVTKALRARAGHWPGKILVVKGASGGLKGAISYRAYPDRAVITAKKTYAALHQFGGEAGKGRTVTIPARPYLMVQEDDFAEIRAAIARYVIGGAP